MSSLGTIYNQFKDISLALIGDFRPIKIIRSQKESLHKILPYEEFLDERGTILLSDGSIGAIWKLEGIEHELNGNIKEKSESVVSALENIIDENTVCQIIFSSKKQSKLDLPDFAKNPKTIAQKIYAKRAHYIENLKEDPTLSLKSHNIYLTLRFETGIIEKKTGFDTFKDNEKQLLAISQKLKAAKGTFYEMCSIAESSMQDADIPIHKLKNNEVLEFLRETINDDDAIHTPHDDFIPLKDQIPQTDFELSPDSIKIGTSKFEVLSWLGHPSVNYAGMFAQLLKIKDEFSFILNIKLAKTADLETKRLKLDGGSDIESTVARKELEEFQTQEFMGAKVFSLGIHMIVKDNGRGNSAKRMVARMRSIFRMPWYAERHAGSGIWLQNLPLAYSRQSEDFTEREKRANSHHLVGYLPIFKGFSGTSMKDGGGMLLQSRAGNFVRVSPQDSEQNQHAAFVAGSGSGKSFFNALYKTAALAQRPDLIMNFIDNATSYEILARVLGAETGYRVIKPPETNLNMFQGEINEARAMFLADMIKIAIKTVGNYELTTAELTLVQRSIEDAYLENTKRAQELAELKEIPFNKIRRSTIRLRDIINILPYIAAENESSKPEHITNTLKDIAKLYPQIFDQEMQEPLNEPPAPGISLYDLSGLSLDPIQRMFAIMTIFSDISRQKARKENAGRAGTLDIEELGILTGQSKELGEMVSAAWKYFRKEDISCTAITNDPKDYIKNDAGQTVWAQSANKFFLIMGDRERSLVTEGQKTKDESLPPLIDDPKISAVIKSLKKENGKFSEICFHGGNSKGSISYRPMGEDYWLAASKKEEKEVFNAISQKLGEPFADVRAFFYLTENYPLGIRDKSGKLRKLTIKELEAIPEDYAIKEVSCLQKRY